MHLHGYDACAQGREDERFEGREEEREEERLVLFSSSIFFCSSFYQTIITENQQ